MTSLRPDHPEASKVIGERYELLRPLREEPWGDVWLAQDNLLGVEVGLKVLPTEAPEAVRGQEILKQEASLALTLRHPQILGVFHLGTGDTGLYLVQEPFSGESLLAQLARHHPFNPTQALHLLEQVSQALAFAHEHGLVHQALNPLQILLQGEEVRVANFACPRGDADQAMYLELKAYDPPEVIQGEAPTPAGNVFSLGVLGFRLVAGSLPYPLTFDEPFPYRLETPPVDLEEVPLALQNVLLQCLAVDPEERLADAAALLAQLRQVRDQWRSGQKEPWGDWESERRRAAWPAAAQASELFGKFWGESKSWGKKVWETVQPYWARFRGAPPRLLWGLGLAGLVLILLLVGHKMWRRLGPPPSPPAATSPFKLPAVGGGPPMVETGEAALGRGLEQAGKPAATPAPAPAAPPEAKPAPKEERYLLVAATFGKEEQARALQQRLKAFNYPTRVVKRTTGGQTRYQVQVGPITGSKEAEDLARRLKAQEKITPKIQPLPATATPAPRRPAR